MYKIAMNRIMKIFNLKIFYILFTYNWLEIIRLSICFMTEIIIAHKNILYNNLELGIRNRMYH